MGKGKHLVCQAREVRLQDQAEATFRPIMKIGHVSNIYVTVQFFRLTILAHLHKEGAYIYQKRVGQTSNKDFEKELEEQHILP
jgi:hypothetical protein